MDTLRCPRCKGTGWRPPLVRNGPLITCPDCTGRGAIWPDEPDYALAAKTGKVQPASRLLRLVK